MSASYHKNKYSPNAPRSPGSELSFSIRNSPDYRTAHSSKRGVYTSPKRENEVDVLDIENIDHEAIQNDSELRSLSRNKAAFNNRYNSQYEEEEILTYDEEGEEYFMNNVVKKILTDNYDINNILSQETPSTPSLTHSFSILSNEPLNNKTENSMERLLTWIEPIISIFKAIFRAIAFLFFMVYWIIKEPIIRTITFFTMIVSTLIVEPILFTWSAIPNNQDWMPSPKLRKQITSWCTLIVFLLLCVPIYNKFEPYLPGPINYFPFKFNQIEQSNSNVMQIMNNLQQELGKTQEKLAKYEKLLEKNNQFISKHQAQHDKNDEFIFKHKLLLDESNQDISKHEILLQKHDQILDNIEYTIRKSIQFEVISYLQQLMKEGYIVTKDGFMDLFNNTFKSFHQSDSNFKNIINSALYKYHQDVLNIADFALESRGASIIFKLTSPTWFRYPNWIQGIHRFAGLPLTTNPPERAISPQTHVGECWNMYGNSGTLGIKLSQSIRVKGIVVEYPSKETIGDMSTAPKDIKVYGIQDLHKNNETQILLGEFYYDIYKNQPIQQFDMIVSSNYFKAILIKIINNWGNQEHTDIYRIRVHGDSQN